MTCSHVQFLLPQSIAVIIWPYAVVSPPGVQNCSNFRDLQCESLLQRAINEATTQKERNPLQEQESFLRTNGTTMYEQHDTRQVRYTTEIRHRAFVNGTTTKWRESGAYRIATIKFCQCVLLAYHTLLYNCWVLLFTDASCRIIWWVLLGWRIAEVWCFRDQNCGVSETIFAAFFRWLYDTSDCVLVVALEICVMWLLLLIRLSATA